MSDEVSVFFAISELIQKTSNFYSDVPSLAKLFTEYFLQMR